VIKVSINNGVKYLNSAEKYLILAPLYFRFILQLAKPMIIYHSIMELSTPFWLTIFRGAYKISDG